MTSNTNYIKKLMGTDRVSPSDSPHTLQHFLLQPVQALNFPIQRGVCFGYSLMGIQALYSKDLNTFNERTNTLISNNREILTYIAEHDASSTPYFTENEQINDIKSFLDNVMLFQTPWEFPQIFGPDYKLQSVKNSAPFTSSQQLEGQGGLQTLTGWTGIYDQESLKDYADALIETARAQDHDMGLLITGHQHAISLTYENATKNWRIIDANNPQINMFGTDLQALLFKAVASIITTTFTNDTCIVFETKPVTVKAQEKYAIAFVENLFKNKLYQAAHEVNERTVNLAAPNGETWLHVAVAHRDAIFSELLKAGADPHRICYDGYSASLHLADYQVKTEIDDYQNLHDLLPANQVELSINGGNYSAKDSISLTTLISMFSEDSLKMVAVRLGEGHFTTFVKKANDLVLLEGLSDDKKNIFLDNLGIQKLVELVKSPKDIVTILRILPGERKKDFLEKLSDEKIFGLITRAYDAIAILKELPTEEASLLLSKISKLDILPNFDKALAAMQIIGTNDNVSNTLNDFTELKNILENKSVEEKNHIISQLVDKDAEEQINSHYRSSEFLGNCSPVIAQIYVNSVAEGRFHDSLSIQQSRNAVLGLMDGSQKQRFVDKFDNNANWYAEVETSLQETSELLKNFSGNTRSMLFDKMSLPSRAMIYCMPLMTSERKKDFLDNYDISQLDNIYDLTSFMDNLSREEANKLLERIPDSQLLNIINDAKDVRIFLDKLPDHRVDDFLDKLYLSLKTEVKSDYDNLLPILEERALERSAINNPEMTEKEIIAQLRQYLSFARSQIPPIPYNQMPKPDMFFSKKTQGKQIAETLRILDKTENLKDAVNLLTDILKVHRDSTSISDPFVTTLVRIMFDPGDDMPTSNKGLLSLSEDELKSFKSFGLSANYYDNSKENIKPASVSKKEVNEAITKLDEVVELFNTRLTLSSRS
jgi:hypothetical protein